MNITCLEINNLSDVNILDLDIDTNFSVCAASTREVEKSVANAFDAYYNNEILFDGIVRSLDYYANTEADFIILTQQQIDYLNLGDDIITVGRNGQQIYLLEFNNSSLRKVLFNV